MPRPVPIRWLRTFRSLALWLIPLWTVTMFAASRIVFRDSPVTLGEEWMQAGVLGLCAGFLGAFVDAWLIPRVSSRIPFMVTLLLRTGAYVLMVLVLVVVGVVVYLTQLSDPLPGSNDPLGGAMSGVQVSEFIWLFLLLLAASFVISLAFQVNRVLGPGTLTALLLGRYLQPVDEDRIFLFLDLTDSTPIAEALGPRRFSDFKNDFFHDVAGPVLATRGEVFQYVGDEVVVSWPFERGLRDANCLQLFFLIQSTIDARQGWYEKRYGVVPRFKAACHGGPVVTAEIGDLKRGIVHSGDTLNTAARIEGQCRPLGRSLLVSQVVLDQCQLPTDFLAVEVGAIPLRGKVETVRLFGVEPAEGPRSPTSQVPSRDVGSGTSLSVVGSGTSSSVV